MSNWRSQIWDSRCSKVSCLLTRVNGEFRVIKFPHYFVPARTINKVYLPKCSRTRAKTMIILIPDAWCCMITMWRRRAGGLESARDSRSLDMFSLLSHVCTVGLVREYAQSSTCISLNLETGGGEYSGLLTGCSQKWGIVRHYEGQLCGKKYQLCVKFYGSQFLIWNVLGFAK